MADLRVAELDFDQIKENLKGFLKGQEYFTDYDFEGSALSILLDVLAYDTHYKAYLANMVINERFLDTSIKRASVVSHAKTLGYVPRSARAAKAIINVTVYGVSSDYTMSIDKYTPFICDVDGQSFTFVTTKAYTTTPSGEFNSYQFNDIEVFEGTPLSYNYLVSSSDVSQTFKLPAMGIDTTTLNVVVQNSSNDTRSTVYSYADSVSVLSPTDTVYFIQEGMDGYYYVHFGDGTLGKPIEAGNIVKFNYLTTNGSSTNTSSISSQVFYLYGDINGYTSSNVIIETVVPSTGGADKESMDKIRFLAPKNYSAQGRTITAEDYKTLLTKDFPEIDSLSVWGGEDNVPPIYGKVFLAVKPINGYVLNPTSKDYIREYLKKTSVVSIQYEFVDPDFTFITINANVKFDSNKTNMDSAQISTITQTAIKSYFTSSLQQFDKSLYISKLHGVIDKLDDSILGNTISIGLQKRIEPVFSLSSSYTLYFNNKITPYTLYTSAFNTYVGTTLYTCAIKDVADTTPPDLNGTGTLVVYDISTGKTLINKIGTVNYSTGEVTITNFSINSYPSLFLYDIRVNVTPQASIDEIANSITISDPVKNATIPLAMRNQILMLDDSTSVSGYNIGNGLTVTATPV